MSHPRPFVSLLRVEDTPGGSMRFLAVDAGRRLWLGVLDTNDEKRPCIHWQPCAQTWDGGARE